ncbi:c-type cytochrome [Leptospira yanagawae]|uniref:c-type cytochrome n=1 Tax=Leptospira yanagawae TaxID=293069 RepID=UPI001FD5A3FA|nr:cytochrome c [Leptospira yanagawae]
MRLTVFSLKLMFSFSFLTSVKQCFFVFILCFLYFQCNAEDESTKKEPPPPKAITVPFPEAMYIQNGCISCHGPEGNGRGTRTHLLKDARIPNFQDITTYVNGSSKEAIAKSIKNGIPGSYMKAYSHMRKNEIDALAEYIQKMQRNNK